MSRENWGLESAYSCIRTNAPFFAATGHNNYLKSVLLYLQDIKNLCTFLKSKYEKGLFTIWRKDKLFWSGTFTDQVIEQDLMLSGKSEGGLINITHKEAARTKWLLSSHVVANYSNALCDFTGFKTWTWSEQHRDMHLNQWNKGYRRLHNFMHFLEIHNPFKASSSNLINIATGTIASSDVNVDSLIDISKRILQKVVNKSLSKITLKKKDQARTFAIMKEAVKIDGKEIIIGTIISETVCISCSGQLFDGRCLIIWAGCSCSSTLFRQQHDA